MKIEWITANDYFRENKVIIEVLISVMLLALT
jgi:hypothetical protein